MFMGGAPQLSKAELKAQEEEAWETLKFGGYTCLVLYLSPHVIDFVSKFIPSK